MNWKIMARKSKKLNISFELLTDTNNIEKVHYDKVDKTLADEHYGYYLMSTLSKSSQDRYTTSRIYLTLRHRQEFYSEKVRNGFSSYKRKVSLSEHCLFDKHKDQIEFLRNTFEILFDKLYENAATILVLRGISLFLELIAGNLNIDSLYDIKTKHQNIVYKILNDKNLDTDVNKRLLSRFFGELERVNNDFDRITNVDHVVAKSKGLKALPSSVVYQLEYYAKKELEDIKKKVEEYNQWINEENNIFTPENVARTFLDGTKNRGNPKTRYRLTLVMLMKKYANIDMYILLSNQTLLNDKENAIYLKTKKIITDLAKNGVNIDVRTVKMHLLLHKELFPQYPYLKKFDKNYINPDIDIGHFRKWLAKYYDSEIDAMDKRQYPLLNTMYPLVLLMMIRHGLNLEVLADLKVRKNENGDYEMDGDSVEMFTVIDATKKRSNDDITIVLKSNSLEKKYLDFYIKWATPLYEKSGDRALFQYGSYLVSIGKQIHKLSSNFLGYVKNSPSSLYNKYEILDTNDERMSSIDHRRLRVSHNYQNYLQGKTEFERQLSKNHKSSNTTREHYENHAEWKDAKKHKIALAQNLVVGVFKGDILRDEHKTAKLINGPMADCKNNNSPTFSGAPDLKENEMCSDWTKCLTRCDKACVIPKIHGAIIYAWIDYMEGQRDNFIRESDWEKEYLIEKDAAEDTVSYFTEDEKKYAINNAYKHASFIQMKFSKIIKTKGLNNA